MSNQRCSDAFAGEAVRLIVDHGSSVAEVSERLRISEQSMNNWVRPIKLGKSFGHACLICIL